MLWPLYVFVVHVANGVEAAGVCAVLTVVAVVSVMVIVLFLRNLNPWHFDDLLPSA